MSDATKAVLDRIEGADAVFTVGARSVRVPVAEIEAEIARLGAAGAPPLAPGLAIDLRSSRCARYWKMDSCVLAFKHDL